MKSNHDYFMITFDYIIQTFRMISYGNAKILYSKKTTGNYHLNQQMPGGLYVNANRWMSSNQHVGQTKIGLLGKITGLGHGLSLQSL